ncbi:hypothetical protein [Chryseobacterium vrystaatense]|uniref:Uncharacterized protein n=1 Tax=Chryseobacterium vrystaatense TaxID=307480 RepID=A0A1M4ZH45_9FLAO|nr:hypothetical protein [Chryseobacterium vrystaatense]SHF17363.1 hypothetical protein SAMN02787073_1596 [Chryseobacterium vrystaatense]
MSKTKYIKVPVIDRMPEEANCYLTGIGPHKYSQTMNIFINERGNIVKPNYWFEEVPDREQEMKEMLEKARDKFLDLKYDKDMPELEEIQCEIEELLNSIK